MTYEEQIAQLNQKKNEALGQIKKLHELVGQVDLAILQLFFQLEKELKDVKYKYMEDELKFTKGKLEKFEGKTQSKVEQLNDKDIKKK